MANALSRKSVDKMEFGAMISVPGVDWTALYQKIQDDSLLQLIITEFKLKMKEHVGFILSDDKLLYKG